MSHLVFDLITIQRGGQSSEKKMDCGGNGSWLPSNTASSGKVGVGLGGVETTRDAGELSWCHPDVPGLWWLHFLTSGCMLLVPRPETKGASLYL